jgi:hypothetical protein
MKKHIFSIVSLINSILVVSPGFASTVTFDDLDTSSLPTLSSYAGFNWSNIFVYPNTLSYDAYASGVVSAPNSAAVSSDATGIFSSATPFNFDSGYLGAAHYDGLSVTVSGLLNGVQEFSQVITVGTTGAQFFLFN